MKYVGLYIERDALDPETHRRQPLDEPRVVLRVATPAGSIREVDLDRQQVAALNDALARAIRALL